GNAIPVEGLIEERGPKLQSGSGLTADAGRPQERRPEWTRRLTVGGKQFSVVTANATATSEERKLVGTAEVLEHPLKPNGRVIAGPPTDEPAAVIDDRRFRVLRHYLVSASFGSRTTGPGDNALTAVLRTLGIMGPNRKGTFTREQTQAFVDKLPTDQVSFITTGSGNHPGHLVVGLGKLEEDLYTSRGRLVAKAGETSQVHSMANDVGNKNIFQTMWFGLRRVIHRLRGTKFEHSGVEPESYVDYTQSRGFYRRSHNAFKIKVLDETLRSADPGLAEAGRAINRAAQQAVRSLIGMKYDHDLSLDPAKMYCSEIAVVVFNTIRDEASKHAAAFEAAGRSDLLKRFQALRFDTEPQIQAGGLLKQLIATPDTVSRHPELEWIAGNSAGLKAYVEVLRSYVSALEPMPCDQVV
ncbi:MAG: hypothetical protein AAF658_07275, partial [Myxococcota bacterium]